MRKAIFLVCGILFLSCSFFDDNPIAPLKLITQSDTVVSQTMDCKISVSTYFEHDTKSLLYYWDIGADGWNDTTVEPWYTFSNRDGGTLEIVWGARSPDQDIRTDTFTIRFNRLPASPAFHIPGPPRSAWNNFDYVLMKGDLRLELAGQDPDGILDTLHYTVWISADSLSWDQIFDGSNSTCIAPSVLSVKKYYWKVRLKDLYGDTVVLSQSRSAPPPPCMVLIPAKNKTFNMGSDKGQFNEQPVHEVSFSNDFYMDTTEITQKQFKDMIRAAYPQLDIAPPWGSDQGLGDNYPAYKVDWHAAVLFCNARTKAAGRTDTVYSYSRLWLNTTGSGYYVMLYDVSVDTSKKGYRLPTEAEWEFACRGGTITEFYWGDDDITKYVWFASNSNGTAHPVAQLLPNNYGLYDMCGNLYEWCNDNYDSVYYSNSPKIDPRGPNPFGPQGGEFSHYRVVRGGGWKRDSSKLRSAHRLYFVEGDAEGYYPHYKYDPLGFRVVIPAK